MQICEVTKPTSPQQQRVDQLKTQLDAARRVAKQTRLNQQQARIKPTTPQAKQKVKKKNPPGLAQWADLLPN